MPNFFHAHAHSEFSTQDSIQSVPAMVAKAAKLGQPALGMTDHGVMSGTVQLYQQANKHDILPYPGLEGYLVEDHLDKDAKRYHIGFLAPTLKAYRALIWLSNLSHSRPHFHRFPRFDLINLAALSEHPGGKELVLMTGCYFGYVQQALVNGANQDGFGFNEYGAQEIVRTYASWFPRTFVEIQNHSIDHPDGITDADICDAMVRIADTLGLPVIATQDTHYLSEYDKPAHGIMKNMMYRGSDVNEFPGNSFHFATTDWVKDNHRKKHWKISEEGYAEILGYYGLKIPPLDKFSAQIPKMSNSPQQALADKCRIKLKSMLEGTLLLGRPKQYKERLEYELNIIDQLKFADYFLHVYDLVNWCRRSKIAVEARGSSNASLVCLILGITQVDPIHFKLTFERFLSLDRQKPPDIDLDVQDNRRDEVVAYVRSKNGAVSIGTYANLGAREADDRGSVLVSYNSHLRYKLGTPEFNKRFGPKGITSISQIEEVNPEDYIGIRRLSMHTVRRSRGVHASGLLLDGDKVKIDDYIPKMLIPKGDKGETIVTQFTQDDVEQLGFLKDDVLGQRTITAMVRCQEFIGRTNPTDFSWIPFDDKPTCRSLNSGNTGTGVFQFDGWTMARGARTMGINNTNDCILAGALFRPACIDSGVTETYIMRRKYPNRRDEIKYPHPAFEEALKSTYGCVLFQEQVLEIMRKLGLDYVGINTFFKIVKDSGRGATGRNIERASEVKKQWDEICDRNGITDKEAAWHYIEGYTKYGFNKAHSTGYGIRSYRAAYLKCHYPLEYMAAVLESVAGDNDKERIYVNEARRIGLRLLSPDINLSGVSWTLDKKRKVIVRGLTSVTGIAEASATKIVMEREANGPFKSIDDMVNRIPGTVLRGGKSYQANGEFTSALLGLKNSGALVSLGIDAS